MKKDKLNFYINDFITAVNNYKTAYDELCDSVERATYGVHSDVFEFSSKDVKELRNIILENYNEIIEKNRHYNKTKTSRLELITSICIDECFYKISTKEEYEKDIEELAKDLYG